MALTFLPRPAAEQSKSRDCTHQGDTQLPFQLHFGNMLIPLNTVVARRAAAVVLGVERRQACREAGVHRCLTNVAAFWQVRLQRLQTQWGAGGGCVTGARSDTCLQNLGTAAVRTSS